MKDSSSTDGRSQSKERLITKQETPKRHTDVASMSRKAAAKNKSKAAAVKVMTDQFLLLVAQ